MLTNNVANSREALQGVLGTLLKEGKTVEVPVFGYSMMPFLKPGVTARVVPVASRGIKRGDVLFFDSGGRLVLHRVLKLLPNGVVCLGDSLLLCDQPVEAPKIFGLLQAWRYNSQWYTANNWRFQLFKLLALYSGGSYQWCAWMYVRLTLKLARVWQNNGGSV